MYDCMHSNCVSQCLVCSKLLLGRDILLTCCINSPVETSEVSNKSLSRDMPHTCIQVACTITVLSGGAGHSRTHPVQRGEETRDV